MRITIETNGEPVAVPRSATSQSVTIYDGGPAPSVEGEGETQTTMAINAGPPAVVGMDHPLVALTVPSPTTPNPIVHDGGPAPVFSDAPIGPSEAPRSSPQSRRTRR